MTEPSTGLDHGGAVSADIGHAPLPDPGGDVSPPNGGFASMERQYVPKQKDARCGEMCVGAVLPAATCGASVCHRLASTPENVRKTLISQRRALTGLGIDLMTLDTAEMVLAEAMNNVVEHAYRGAPNGWIDVQLDAFQTCLGVTICDAGCQLPGLRLPEAKTHDLSVDLQDLPEGGFGWALIRGLTHDLAYERVGGVNVLRFCVRKFDA